MALVLNCPNCQCRVEWTDAVFPYSAEHDGAPSGDDSAPFVPKSVVISPYFDWSGDRRIQRPYNETIIYEAHVKGMTQTHPAVPPELRGTYAGLAHPAIIEHLKVRDDDKDGSPVPHEPAYPYCSVPKKKS